VAIFSKESSGRKKLLIFGILKKKRVGDQKFQLLKESQKI